jgi:cobalt/nickel transport system permease protein
VPLLALGAAFSFVVMMFNIPIPGGTTGHATGGALVAILLGPWAACVAVSLALVIQAFLFGDGGITALGANCFTMAVIMPFVGSYTYRFITGNAQVASPRRVAAGFVAGYLALNAAALYTALLFGLQPLIASAPDGRPLYAPYPAAIAVPAMALPHLLVFGLVEGMATALIIKYLQRSEPALLAIAAGTDEECGSFRRLWYGMGGLALLTPLGLVLPSLFNAGDAWGEWSPAELAARIGFLPKGMGRLASVWRAPLADYALGGGEKEGLAKAGLVYGLCAVIGVVVAVFLVHAARKYLAGREGK